MSRPARRHRPLAHVAWTASCALWLTCAPSPTAEAAQPEAECREWRACRDRALAAESAADGERFHDLAWRTVQLGPKDEPELMYLLARAQATSGRPSDALVMLQRLARLGVATDADTLEVFRRVRARPAWAEVDAAVATASRRLTASGAPEGLAARAAADVPAPVDKLPPTPPAPAAVPASASAPVRPAVPALAALGAREALRLDGLSVASGGFAYDAVSGRFLLGSTDERKIVVVDEPSRRAADLVRGDSAGFRQMVALQIDTRRGDLWVVSNDAGTAEASGGATLHKLQLVAGRPLARLEAPGADGEVRFTDLTVTPGGAVLLVDAAGRRVYRAAARATTLTAVATLDVAAPVALTAAASDDIVYVAHAGGVSRVDLARRTTQPVSVPADGASEGIGGLWWHDGGLVVMQTQASGARRLQRWALDRSGTAVSSLQPLEVALPDAARPVAVTLSGHDLFVLSEVPVAGDGNGGGPSGDRPVRQAVVHRVRLRP